MKNFKTEEELMEQLVTIYLYQGNITVDSYWFTDSSGEDFYFDFFLTTTKDPKAKLAFENEIKREHPGLHFFCRPLMIFDFFINLIGQAA